MGARASDSESRFHADPCSIVGEAPRARRWLHSDMAKSRDQGHQRSGAPRAASRRPGSLLSRQP